MHTNPPYSHMYNVSGLRHHTHAVAKRLSHDTHTTSQNRTLKKKGHNSCTGVVEHAMRGYTIPRAAHS